MALGFLLLTPLAIVATKACWVRGSPGCAGWSRGCCASQLGGNVAHAGHHGGDDRRPGAVRFDDGLGIFDAGAVQAGRLGARMLVALQSGGLPDAEIDAVPHIEGVIPQQCIPLAVEQPRLASDITDSGKATRSRGKTT